MERRPHRDQRMILRYLTAFCPYCYLFPPLFFFPISLSRVGRERSSGCCVILLSRFIGATHNFVPLLCFIPDDGTHQRHLYLIVSYTPVSGPHLVSPFSYHHYPVAVCSASLALAPIVCAYYFFAFDPSRCVYFLSDLPLLFCLYSPLTVVFS